MSAVTAEAHLEISLEIRRVSLERKVRHDSPLTPLVRGLNSRASQDRHRGCAMPKAGVRRLGSYGKGFDTESS